MCQGGGCGVVGVRVGEGWFCGAVSSVGDGVSRRQRGVIVPTPFCRHTLLLLNGRIKENAWVLIFELHRHRCTNTHTHAAELSLSGSRPTQIVCVCFTKHSHRLLCTRIYRSHLHCWMCCNDVTCTYCRVSFYRSLRAFFFSHNERKRSVSCEGEEGKRERVLSQDPPFLYSSPSSPTLANEPVQQAKGPFIANLIHFSRQLWNLPLTLVITPRLTKRWSQLINDP